MCAAKIVFSPPVLSQLRGQKNDEKRGASRLTASVVLSGEVGYCCKSCPIWGGRGMHTVRSTEDGGIEFPPDVPTSQRDPEVKP
jgi:hypothetical protein